MADRKCRAKTKKGKRCQAPPLKGKDFCLAHSPAETRESAGFIADNGKGGRPPTPKLIDIFRERLEAAVDQVMAPYFQALGITGWNEDGTPIVDESAGAMEIGRSNTGDVRLTDIADLGARMHAAERIIDRVHGRPRQTQEITGPQGGPVELISPSDAERRSIEAAKVMQQARAEREAIGTNGNGNGSKNGHH